jgi:tRNA-dihydrouridine synthase B
MSTTFAQLLAQPGPLLALAPMQDVTDRPFWGLMSEYGGPDVYWTEYFRVHAVSNLEPWILESIKRNPTGKPAIAQLIGNDIPSLVRNARKLQKLPVVAIDLNLGCPAPVVYRKCAGGGLLREPEKVDAILGALRDAVEIAFTVKTRIGFDDPAVFDQLLPIFAKHRIDLLTIHGRTVKEMYRSEVHYEYIERAVRELPFPVVANGNVYSAAKGVEVLGTTGARGLMIGRGAIRNPWIFDQIRQQLRGERLNLPTAREVLRYVEKLWDATAPDAAKENAQTQKMKKYMNFLCLGAEPTGRFLHEIRRVATKADFFAVCREFLDHDGPMPLEPFHLELKETDVLAGAHL